MGRAAEEEKKKQEMLEAEIKRQEMMAAQKEKGGSKQSAPALDARKEMSKSKEQVEEEMKISPSIRIKPLNLDAMDSDELRAKANQIWNTIVSLETDKYDYEQRHQNQDYEFKELTERQKIQLRNKAVKKGLDPESFTGAHPPKIRMFSKYERRTDTRTYGKKNIMNGLRDQKPDFLSGLGNVLAKSLEIQKLLKVKRMVVQKKWRKRRRKKRKKKRSMMRRKKNKSLKYVLTENNYKPIIHCHCFHT